MTFEEWKEDYGLVYAPNYCEGTDADCRAAFTAGAASRDAEVAQWQKIIGVSGSFGGFSMMRCTKSLGEHDE